MVPAPALCERVQQTEGKRIDATSILGGETRTINAYPHFCPFTYLGIGAGDAVIGE